MKYMVMVDDNFHFMDSDDRYCSGSFATAEEAIAHCREIVDGYLANAIAEHPTLSADALLDSYKAFGDDPFIVADGAPRVAFSAWNYAQERCAALCAATASPDTTAARGSRA